MFIVSFLPETPGSHQEDFKEEWAPPGVFSLLKQLEAAGEGWPANPKFLPARLTEWASKDHMVHNFLVVVAAEQATVVINYVIMSTLEHVTCIQSVIH